MSLKISDTQLVILQDASRRDDRCIALPARLKGSAAQKVAGKLIAAGLAREIKSKEAMPVWRRNADQAFALKLTAAGLKIAEADADAPDGREDESASSREAIERPNPAETGSSVQSSQDVAPREGSKLAQVIAMLRRTGGATIGDLTSATGWLPHTTRAAMTGLRKRGYAVILERTEVGGSAYRISSVNVAASDVRSSQVPQVAPMQGKRALRAA